MKNLKTKNVLGITLVLGILLAFSTAKAQQNINHKSNTELINSELEPYIEISSTDFESTFTYKTDQINSDDVKYISVLKGEAALKRYGQKAKYGAVLVTLKDGIDPKKYGERIK